MNAADDTKGMTAGDRSTNRGFLDGKSGWYTPMAATKHPFPSRNLLVRAEETETKKLKATSSRILN